MYFAGVEAKLKSVRQALINLMAAHRTVFRSHSLFASFQAGKTSFTGAWHDAEEALAEKESGK